ncbi:ATP synthase F1 subunit gamma [Candidatus Uhrbacteria bacterium]|nr:ATP synthase F1 subunit gamma [Candidatus Uhrbacteria bacterium]
MPTNARVVRRRIRSITSTRKITKAMELVAGAKMRKAVAAVLATRPYSDVLWRAVRELSERVDPNHHPLLRRSGGSGRELTVVFSADRGLCGGINGRLVRALDEASGGDWEGRDYAVIGRRGQQALRRRGAPVVASWPGIGHEPRVSDVLPVARLAIDDFGSGRYSGVSVAFTDFRSSLVQEPRVRRLLPLSGVPSELGSAEDLDGRPLSVPGIGAESVTGEFLFEPSVDAVVSAILPRLVEVQLYQAMLESLASEHSARMMAMRSASDSAGDMIQSLTLALNQARQAAITMEIAEISSGKAALEQNS